MPVEQQLSDNLLSEDGELTIAAWFQSLTVGGAMSGTVLALSSSPAANSSHVSFSLGFFPLRNGTTVLKFSLQVMTSAIHSYSLLVMNTL